MVRDGVHYAHCFFSRKTTHVHVARQDFDQSQGIKNMKCQECNHEKGKCQCLCCCSISQIGCVYCIIPVLGHRQIKKILRKWKNSVSGIQR